jgi:hypothetical protein
MISNSKNISGYQHPAYAESLSEFGKPVELPKCEGLFLQRSIPDFHLFDGMGCYPIFSCMDWEKLPLDMQDLKDNLVTLSLVADPFGNHTPQYLNEIFDKVIPFKEHLLIDLKQEMVSFIHSHHRRNVKKALTQISVELSSNPEELSGEWIILYKNLIERHNIKGIPAFSEWSLSKQLQVPGITLFRAVYQKETVGIIIWYSQDDKAFYHLGAYNDTGYKLRASFALFWKSIEHFQTQDFRWLSLGAGAGVKNSTSNGLAKFKQGWATESRTVYFCGKVFNQTKYDEILKVKNVSEKVYFPAYRVGEFG